MFIVHWYNQISNTNKLNLIITNMEFFLQNHKLHFNINNFFGKMHQWQNKIIWTNIVVVIHTFI